MRSLPWIVGLSLLAAGCGSSEEAAAPPADPPPAELKAAEKSPVDEVREARKAPEAPVVDKLPDGANPAMLDPSLATETAPAQYKVKLDTTKGEVILTVKRDWAPNGADRFYNLVKIGYYSDIAFFRAIGGFMAQCGISGYPAVNTVWREARIKDDPPKGSNTKGIVTFATAGPNTRTTQFFISYKDNSFLDTQGFSPFAEVTSGMEVIDSLYKGYGEGAPRGKGPNQMRMQTQGNSYLRADFPELDYIKSASIVE